MTDIAPQFLEFDGKRFVVVSEADFEALCEAAEDAADAAVVARFGARLAAGDDELVPAAAADRLLAGENPVRAWREHRGLTAEALAKAARLSRATVSQIEGGTREGTIATIAAIAVALGLDAADLIAWLVPHTAAGER
jgi:DNA-binding XRE family transcriptional regulator